MRTVRKTAFPGLEDAAAFLSGKELFAYRYLGAHPALVDGEEGAVFGVWAPKAAAVSVAGDFNGWQEDRHPLRPLAETGIWYGFIAGLKPGDLYKYAVRGGDGQTILKADPFAFGAEMRPKTASALTALSGYAWGDKNWRRSRRGGSFRRRPVNVYEIHLGSWKRREDGGFLSYRELAALLIPYLTEMGYTHVEFMPLMEHPHDGSWGYQITGYFAATSRYGSPQDLMYLIDRLHQAKIGVIMDWVPGHFCKDRHGLISFDGGSLYEKEDHAEWGTMTFDFANPGVQSFLLSNAAFWIETFHIDGLRVDGVSSMLYLNYGRPDGQRKNERGGDGDLDAIAFLRTLNESILAAFPDTLMIAEESSAWPLVTYPPYDGGLGFHYKWNMGWMNDTLRYVSTKFSQRRENHRLLNFPMVYAFSENHILPFSHDEVVHGKGSLIGRMPGSYEERFAGLRLLLAYQICHPGAKLSFMGNEFGQFIEWRFDEGLEWFLLDHAKHREMLLFAKTLHTLYLKERCLWERDDGWEGFEWIDADNGDQGMLIFARRGENEGRRLVVVLNFQPRAYAEFSLGVPGPGLYREVLNSDDVAFGGGGTVNPKAMRAKKRPCHGREYAVNIKVPPLGAVLLGGKIEKSEEEFHV